MAKLPNSNNIADIIKDFEKFSEQQASIVATVKNSVNSVRGFASIKIDKKVKEGLKNMKDVKKTFNAYSSAIADMVTGIENMIPDGLDGADGEMQKKMSLLTGNPESIMKKFDSDGKTLLSEETTKESKGLLDSLSTVIGLFKSVSELKEPNTKTLRKSLVGYTDSISVIFEFFDSVLDTTNVNETETASKAIKNLMDATVQIPILFDSVKEEIIPAAEKIVASKRSLESGLTLLYNSDKNKFSIIRKVIDASIAMSDIDKAGITNADSSMETIKDMISNMMFSIGILGLPIVGGALEKGSSVLNNLVKSIKETASNAESYSGNEFENFTEVLQTLSAITGSVGEMLNGLTITVIRAKLINGLTKGNDSATAAVEWIGRMLGAIDIPAPKNDVEANAEANAHIVELMAKSAHDLINISGKIIFAVPKTMIASSVLSWLYEKISKDMSDAVSMTSAWNIRRLVLITDSMAKASGYLLAFSEQMPSKRKIKKSIDALLVIGELLGDEEVQAQFKEAIAAIDLMVGEKDSLGQLNGLLDTVASAMKSAAQAGIWCALGIPGMMLVGLAAKVMERAVYQLMLVMSGFSKEEIADTRQQFEDLGKMVLLAGATVAVCALVGALVILALPEILLGFAAIGAVVLVFAGLLRLIDFITGGKQFKSNAEAIADLGRLILLAGAVIAISVLVGLLVIKAFKLILVGFAALMVVTVALIGVLWLIGKVGEIPGLKTGMLMMIAMIMSMMLAALMITVVAKVGAGIDLEGILKFTLTLAIISAAYMGIGLLMAAGGILAVVLATAGIVLISLSMLMITGAIASVNKTLSKTDPEQTKDNIAAMLDTMKYTVDYINDNFSVTGMAKAASKMFLMANMSKHLMRMASRIQRIASLTMDEFDEAGHPTGRTVKMKTQDFVDAALNGVAVAQTIAAMLDSEPTVITTSSGTFTVNGLSDEVLQRITTKSKRKIRQLSKITKFIGKMATTVADIASLNMATEWNEDGKPVSFQKMTTQDFVNASLNGTAVAKLMASILDENETVIETSVGNVAVKGIPEATLEKITNSAKRKFRQLNKITKFIGRMTETVAKIASLKVATEWNADGKPINFEAITADQMKDAALNATAIVKFFAAVATNQNTTLTMAGGQTLTVEATTENMFEKVDRELKRKFRFLGQIVNTIAGATKTVTDLASLRVPVAWSADGKPTKYVSITSDQMKDAAENVVTIMTTLMDAVVGEKMIKKLNAFDRGKKRAMDRMFAAVTPITSMVETVIALAGGSLEEYDAEGHPTGKQVSVLKALEAKPDIINGIVSIYSIFTDALAVITGKDSAAEVTVAQSKGLLGRVVNKVASAVTAVVDAGVSMVKNLQSSVDTATAANNIKMIVDPIMSMVDAVKKINDVMSSVDLSSADNLKYVMAGSVAAVAEIGEKDFAVLERRTKILDEYANVVKKFMDANSKNETADNVHRTMEDTGKFVVQLNKVNDNKLAKMASIAKNMADFARKINGNFDRLADAMNEKMVTALDKVDKTLKEVNKTMNEMPGKMRSAVSTIKVTGGNGGDDKPKGTGSESVTDKSKKQTGKGSNGKNVTGKSVNNCIVQADDGTFALAVIQKYE